MSERARFRHDVSRYERPNTGWLCGRACAWGKPCPRGPSADGECRESPACSPRRSLRQRRFHLSIAAFGLALGLIALLLYGSGALSSVDPGPLSATHAQFTGEAGCSTCHAAHGKGPAAWLAALVAPSRDEKGAAAAHSLSAGCAGCHGFGGENTQWLAHNRIFEKRAEIGPTTCTQCHTEHRGENAEISVASDGQCNACHAVKVHGFAVDHPPFPKGFPHERAINIKFDHAQHLEKHFADARFAKLAPAGGCVGCHQVSAGGRAILPTGFDQACAGCHAEGIAKREFVLLRLPEFPDNPVAAKDVAKQCGVEPEAGDYSAVSADTATPLRADLLGADGDDSAAYGPPMAELLNAMLNDGADALVDRLKARGGDRAAAMFAGLNAETVKRAACAWAANKEYEAVGSAALAGWRADGLEFKYLHRGHADPVLKAWLEFAVAAGGDGDDAARAEAMRKEFLSASEGPGQCAKCHTAVAGPDGAKVAWRYAPATMRAFTRFNHRPHVDLLGPEKTCTACHKPQAAAAIGAPEFRSIEREGCASCHAAGKVRDDCQTCHVYHQEHTLLRRMMSDAK